MFGGRQVCRKGSGESWAFFYCSGDRSALPSPGAAPGGNSRNFGRIHREVREGVEDGFLSKAAVEEGDWSKIELCSEFADVALNDAGTLQLYGF